MCRNFEDEIEASPDTIFMITDIISVQLRDEQYGAVILLNRTFSRLAWASRQLGNHLPRYQVHVRNAASVSTIIAHSTC
jgi:hypothetical protein